MPLAGVVDLSDVNDLLASPQCDFVKGLLALCQSLQRALGDVHLVPTLVDLATEVLNACALADLEDDVVDPEAETRLHGPEEQLDTVVAVVDVAEDGSVFVARNLLEVAHGVPVGLRDGLGHLVARLALAQTHHAVAVADNDERVETWDFALAGLVRDTLHHKRAHRQLTADVVRVEPRLLLQASGNVRGGRGAATIQARHGRARGDLLAVGQWLLDAVEVELRGGALGVDVGRAREVVPVGVELGEVVEVRGRELDIGRDAERGVCGDHGLCKLDGPDELLRVVFGEEVCVRGLRGGRGGRGGRLLGQLLQGAQPGRERPSEHGQVRAAVRVAAGRARGLLSLAVVNFHWPAGAAPCDETRARDAGDTLTRDRDVTSSTHVTKSAHTLQTRVST